VISRRCSDPPVRDLGRGQFPQSPGYPAPWRHLRQRLGKNVPDGAPGTAAVLGLREMPGPDAAFSLAGTGWAGALLSGAGFGGIEFAKADEPMLIGRDVDDVLEYERTFPSASEVLTGLSPAQAAELTRQVRDRLAAYASPGGVTMPGAAWLVTARAG
jgi:hypothetical protein